MRKSILRLFAALLAMLMLLSACGPAEGGSTVLEPEKVPMAGAPEDSAPDVNEDEYVDQKTTGEVTEQEVAAMVTENNQYIKATPAGTTTKSDKNNRATVDYSNLADGYVMAKFNEATDKRIKVVVQGPTGAQYQYNLVAQKWAVLPLSDGNGKYKVTVYLQAQGTKYSSVVAISEDVTMEDPMKTFLTTNQYVDIEAAPETQAKAAEICKGITDPLKMVEAVYNYVVNNMTYDKQLAQTVQSGYLPVLDTVLAKKTGICFDYAALMTGMLRTQGVPCKLVVGYAGTAYHAWISVYSKDQGWIEGVIFFNGDTWERMDPTFASTGQSSENIMQYIGDGKNYTPKYFY